MKEWDDCACLEREIWAGDRSLRLILDHDMTGEATQSWELVRHGPGGEALLLWGDVHDPARLMDVIDSHMLSSLPGRADKLPLGKTVFELNELVASPERMDLYHPEEWQSRTSEQRRETVSLFDAYRDAGVLSLARPAGTREDCVAQIVEGWALGGGFADPARHLIIAPDQAEPYLVDLNATIQRARWKAGDLGAESLCYQTPAHFGTTRHHMVCEGDRVVVAEPPDEGGWGRRELGAVVGIDRRRALVTARLDRGAETTVSLAHRLDGGRGEPPDDRLALGYAVGHFPRDFPHDALVVLSHERWEETHEIRRTTMHAAVFQQTAGGSVRFFADKHVHGFHMLQAHSANQRQLLAREPDGAPPRRRAGLGLGL